VATTDDIPPCQIFIDKGGRWFHKGVEMIHREFIKLFYENMSLDSEGRYVITLEGERCHVDVEDTPFIVRKALFKDSVQSTRSRIILFLSDETQENLSPESLYVGIENVLYCRVRGGTFPARFDRPAYYQLAQHIEQMEGSYFLRMNGKKYMIPIKKLDRRHLKNAK